MVTETSIMAWRDVQEELGDRHQLVLDCYKTLNKPLNARMVKEFLGIPINQITPRILELREMRKCLTYSHTAECPITKRQTEFWKLTLKGEALGKKLVEVKVDILKFRPYRRIEVDNYSLFEFWVVSNTNNKKVYHVDLKLPYDGEPTFNCDCHDYTFKHINDPNYTCKHIRKAISELRKDEILE